MTGEEHTGTNAAIGAIANPIIERVWQLAEPLCRDEGMELVHVAFHREPAGRILRLYLDKPGGVTLDDCATISRQLGDLLDVALETQGAYRLEVSSPGERRPLGRVSDFERFRGHRAQVRISRPINGRKNFTGTLEGARGSSIQMVVDNQVVDIVFADIVKAHLLQPNGENAC
ncbi:MAG: ribosome maturation factor RimP [Desulfatitalea sp.]|nr:ribosome maturation factor RimP [Desulfatitalea sp.]